MAILTTLNLKLRAKFKQNGLKSSVKEAHVLFDKMAVKFVEMWLHKCSSWESSIKLQCDKKHLLCVLFYTVNYL